MFNGVISHKSIVETLASKSEQIFPGFQQNISTDQLLNKYQSLHDRVKVAPKYLMHCILMYVIYFQCLAYAVQFFCKPVHLDQ